MNIPIENVYYLLCYAWNHLQESELVDVSEFEGDRPQDLFGTVLAEGVARLLRRGLDRGYVEKSEDVLGIRGKLDLSTTLKRNLLPRSRAHCLFDELQYDVPHNRILKSSLRAVSRLRDLDVNLRDRVLRLLKHMSEVSDISLLKSHFQSIQIYRSNRLYDFLMKLCLLIHENLIIDEEAGGARFHDFRRDEARMWQVFEDFVFNFYDREQDVFRVSRRQIQWHDARGTERALKHLPIMRTDVFLESSARRIILDCKYVTQPLSRGRFGDERVRTENLYQIFSYVANRAATEGQNPPHEGVLLYPVVKEKLDFRYSLMGHPISIRSIDLDQPWWKVHQDMLDILN